MDTEIQVRPVRIHFAMDDSRPVPRAIKKCLLVLCNDNLFVYVDSMDDADLVLFVDARAIESGFSMEKDYAFIVMYGGEKTQEFPDNVSVLSMTKIVAELVELVEGERNK